MARRTFFSFHFKPDNWRASQVRNAGALEGNRPVSDNDWESITGGGDPAIKKWIGEQMWGRSCAVVLVGTATAGRKWITYEINEAWTRGMGVVGVCVHNLQDASQRQSPKGASPFTGLFIGSIPMSSIVKVYDPPYTVSTNVYSHIKNNIAGWADEACEIRGKY